MSTFLEVVGGLTCLLVLASLGLIIVARINADRRERRLAAHARPALTFSAPAPPCPTADVVAHPDLAELDAVCDRLYLT